MDFHRACCGGSLAYLSQPSREHLAGKKGVSPVSCYCTKQKLYIKMDDVSPLPPTVQK